MKNKSYNILIQKITAFLLCICMIFVLAACRNDADVNNSSSENSVGDADENLSYEAHDIKAAVLKGPTAIGMVKLMEEAKENEAANRYEFNIAASADEFSASLIKGDIQIAALPCNAAAALYNKSGGKIKVLGINTLGVLYIVENGDSVQSVSDLKGKTIYTTGKGTTPEYTLKYLLEKAGLDPDKDVNIEFKSEASEAAVMLLSGEQNAVAMLPQPYVTTAMMNNSDIRIALDVTEEWERLADDGSTVVTGVIAVNSDYYNNNREAVSKFMEEYAASVEYVNENIDEAAQLVEDFGIFKADVAKKAIPYCNITFISGDEMKSMITKYLTVLNDANPLSIGGNMPDDGFYAQ